MVREEGIFYFAFFLLRNCKLSIEGLGARASGLQSSVGRRDFNIFKGVGTKRRIWSIPQF